MDHFSNDCLFGLYIQYSYLCHMRNIIWISKDLFFQAYLYPIYKYFIYLYPIYKYKYIFIYIIFRKVPFQFECLNTRFPDFFPESGHCINLFSSLIVRKYTYLAVLGLLLEFRRPYVVPGTKPGLAVCKANVLPTVLSR